MTNTEPLTANECEDLFPLALATIGHGSVADRIDDLHCDLLMKLDRLGWTRGLTGLSNGGRDCLQRMAFSAVEAMVSEGVYRSQVVQE